MWYHSKFFELIEESRIPLRRNEILEFLACGYENCVEGKCAVPSSKIITSRAGQ